MFPFISIEYSAFRIFIITLHTRKMTITRLSPFTLRVPHFHFSIGHLIHPSFQSIWRAKYKTCATHRFYISPRGRILRNDKLFIMVSEFGLQSQALFPLFFKLSQFFEFFRLLLEKHLFQ